MKRFPLIVLALLMVVSFSLPVYAQKSKVIDRSAKTLPKWLGVPPEDYLVAEVEAPSISAAKDQVVEELARRVVMSVATNVIYETRSSGSVETVNGKTTDGESFAFDSRIASARIPFIKGISLTDATESYWEKCREAKTNRIFYRYAVLYPLPKSELERMRKEFNAADAEKGRRLKALRTGLATVSSVLQIESAVTELNELHEYFFDDVRRQEAEGLLTNYKQLYKGLTLHALKPIGGKFTVSLQLQGRPFEATGTPVLKANCASRLQATPLTDGTGYEITYDDTDCLPDEDNWIDISLRMRDARITQRIYI